MNKVFLLIVCGLVMGLQAQEVTPRRWSHLPIGSSFAGAGLVVTEADIYFDPVLQVEDVTAEVYSIPVAYTYSFAFLNRSTRIDLAQVYQQAKWEGLLAGEFTTVEREGFADTTFRLAMNVVGAPPLKGKEFVAYRKAHQTETLVGIGLNVTAPTGEYYSDKLLNLGNNRWVIRPQIGVVHSRNRWSYELTGAVWFFTDNDDFWQNTVREQEPLLALQGHLIYTYLPGCWMALSAAYGVGAENSVNDVTKDDESENLLYALSAGLPFNRTTGIKLSWIRGETKTATGSDTNSLMLVLSKMF